MSHVCRTHVCTDSLVARVTIGRKEAPFRMSHVYTCVQFRRTPRTHVCNFGGPPYTCVQFRRPPCTHVYTEDPSAARGRHLGWVIRRTLYTCVHGGPLVHMCTRRTPEWRHLADRRNNQEDIYYYRLPKLKKTGHFAVLCKFYNFECQRDSRQTFFTSFERGSDDSYPFLMIMTDSKVLFSYVWICTSVIISSHFWY